MFSPFGFISDRLFFCLFRSPKIFLISFLNKPSYVLVEQYNDDVNINEPIIGSAKTGQYPYLGDKFK